MKKWVSEKIPEIVNCAYSAKGVVFGFVSTTGASLQARSNSRRRRRKDLSYLRLCKEGLTRRISCKPEDGQKWNRRSEPTANLTPAHGRRWGRKSRETDQGQGLRHAQGQKCRDRGCTVNPFQFTVQRFKGSFNPEWSTKQAQFEMN
ncbi:hypothetical protein TIFTF001_016033 [Ficus carica]|uniref:Uncharacterized protein n=1 Tax=Ficus carica TaxID=3494 RepID=A0AA87ZZN4_FICCA|nr:hypothetical protein TIFTF001_016033 [Ficus carica]